MAEEQGKIALCRRYMFFEHAWSGKEAFGSAFEQILSVYYIHEYVFNVRHPGLRYYIGAYDKVINIFNSRNAL